MGMVTTLLLVQIFLLGWVVIGLILIGVLYVWIAQQHRTCPG
jgi:hypothetical protein